MCWRKKMCTHKSSLIRSNYMLPRLSLCVNKKERETENPIKFATIQYVHKRYILKLINGAGNFCDFTVILMIKTFSSYIFIFMFYYSSHTCVFCTIGWLYLIPTVISVTAAMLSKEQGITICGICAIYEIFVAQKVGI